MAGDWIKMRIDLHDDPAVWAMADALDISTDEVVGRLLRVWGWADRHTTDGHACVTLSSLDRHAGVTGFAHAMRDAGWLTLDDDNMVTFPNFERHNGTTAKKRAQASSRQIRARQKRDTSVTEALQERDRSVTREEKRRVNTPHTPQGGGATYSVEFDQWWEQYPHKVGKGAAFKAWQKARKTADADTLTEGVKRYVRAKPDDRPWCNPATWLNQRRWEDDPADGKPSPRQQESEAAAARQAAERAEQDRKAKEQAATPEQRKAAMEAMKRNISKKGATQ